MKIIRFVQPMESYTIDDVASFDDKLADKIVEKGYATEITLEETRIENKKK